MTWHAISCRSDSARKSQISSVEGVWAGSCFSDGLLRWALLRQTIEPNLMEREGLLGNSCQPEIDKVYHLYLNT